MKLLGNYKNGNTTCSIYDDGTKIRRTEDNDFEFDFPESIDINITNYCDGGCQWCYQGCSKEGLHADILSPKFLDTLHPYTEIAINGNSLDHPDLFEFLQKMKNRKIIVNMTVNQVHFLKHKEFIKSLTNGELIYGLGVSLTKSSDDLVSSIKEFSNAVIHVINGIIEIEELKKLYNHNLKILILGYKMVKKGVHYYSKTVENNKEILYDNLKEIMDCFSVVSFDNLALEQLDVKRLLTENEWDIFFMGDDGRDGFNSASMYIDLVDKKFTYNSCREDRYELLEDIKDMYLFLKNNY